MKKLVSLFIVLIIIIQTIPAFAITDEFIFTDPVKDEFIGRTEGLAIINNINFADLLPGHPSKEAVARAGALNIIKGGDSNFNSQGLVSNVDMLAAVLRAMGREQEAQDIAARLAPTLPQGSPLRTELKIGYISLANQLGLITGAQYANALAADQSALDPTVNFVYDAPVSLQVAANWIYTGLNLMNANAFTNKTTTQKVFNYADWNQINAVNLKAMEALAANGVIQGDEFKMIYPSNAITNAKMVDMFKNLDNIYYNAAGIQKRTGTVGGIKEEYTVSTGEFNAGVRAFVRTSKGDIDVLKNYLQLNKSAPVVLYDAPVYSGGYIGGFELLEEGDEIEYLVNPETSELLYIEVTGEAPMIVDYVTGKLQSIDHTTGKITIKDDNGTATSFTMISGLYFTENEINYVYVDYKKQKSSDISIGSTIKLRLKNNICDEIYYIGEPNAVDEFRGIVLENDTDVGYMVVLDNRGKKIFKNYYTSDIKVKKKEYYIMDDEIGYISEVFPFFKYNPLDSDIYAVEPGDIVFIRNDPDNPEFIKSISASTNYIAKYGKILQFNFNGDYYEMLLEYENKQTTWFEVSPELFITRFGKPVTAETVVPGDWVRVLVNQAIISPGYVMESAKELVLESAGHNITTILKGQLAGINAVQNQLLVQNVQTLTNTGWNNYKQADNFNLSGRDIEYYYDGKQISMDYALKYFKRADNEVYIALEGNYAGSKVRKVTFRSGRDQLLSPDTVINSDKNGNFAILGNSGNIKTDSGTIVRRHGRLVSGINIMIPDYAVVSLNGGNTAAVVDIVDAPGNSQIIMARGRVISVDEGKSFKVQSMSVLSGTDWLYTPIAREFAIDYNTVFINADGITTLNKFVDYNNALNTDITSSINKVYNILTDGTRAARIIEAPYCTKAVRGIVYATDTDKIYLKSATYLNSKTGAWMPVSNVDATLEITLHPNTFITKNNQVIGQNSIKTGEQLMIMTDKFDEQNSDKVTSGAVLDGYMIFVEK